MTAVAWVLWAAATATALGYVAMQITGLDGRRLRAIQASSFGCVPVAAALPSVVLVALAGSGLLELPRRPPFAALFVALLVHAILRVTKVGRSTGRQATGPRLCVATVNIERDSSAVGRIAGQLRALRADLLLIQEYTPAAAAACMASGIHDDYPHRAEDPRDGYFGSALFSRHPLATWSRFEVGARPAMMAVLEVGGVQVTVVNVHVQAPMHRRDLEPWRASFDELGRVAEGAGGPVILAGDWNAVPSHPPLRRMLRRYRLVDAHLARARRRWPRTWPTDRWWLPPLLCLDHVVLTADIAVLAVREERVAGTDHKVVIANLQLLAA